jgi:hypothetical protein
MDDGLAARLLTAAGLPPGPFRTTPVSGPDSVNRSWAVRTGDGRYALREYRWPYAGADDLDRPLKEEWLSAPAAARRPQHARADLCAGPGVPGRGGRRAGPAGAGGPVSMLGIWILGWWTRSRW